MLAALPVSDVTNRHSALSTMQLAVECLLLGHRVPEADSTLVSSEVTEGLLCTPVVRDQSCTAW